MMKSSTETGNSAGTRATAPGTTTIGIRVAR